MNHDEEEPQLLSQHLAKEFEITTKVKLDTFFGIEVATLKRIFSYPKRNTLLIC